MYADKNNSNIERKLIIYKQMFERASKSFILIVTIL